MIRQQVEGLKSISEFSCKAGQELSGRSDRVPPSSEHTGRARLFAVHREASPLPNLKGTRLRLRLAPILPGRLPVNGPASQGVYDMTVIWDGTTKENIAGSDEARKRHALADAARDGAWDRALDLLYERPAWINCSRPGGVSGYAPLHQAAWCGAPVEVVERLIEHGAWRTLQNTHGERPVDIAERNGHTRLSGILTPVYKHRVPWGILLRLQANFHSVIRGRAEHLVQKHSLRLPVLTPLLELEKPEMWFSVPGMAGGFSYRLESAGIQPRLISDSWCRVVGGSGETHEITHRGSRLTRSGF